MNLALIGYGKLGKMIKELAERNRHKVVVKIYKSTESRIKTLKEKKVDVAIECSVPNAVLSHAETVLEQKIPLVIATTGWHNETEKMKSLVQKHNGSLIWDSNFSIGMNIIFELNKKLAALMRSHPEYKIVIGETHHLEKKDKPSGTAIKLAQQILENNPNKKKYKLKFSYSEKTEEDEIPIFSYREGEVVGVHNINYLSDVDILELKHRALSREAFARGVLLAAEFIAEHKGIYTMRDVIDSARPD